MEAVRSRAGPVLGRRRELAQVTEDVRTGTVTYVHGLPGVGKSALLDAFVDDARGRGVDVIALDCRAVEPTERGFLGAVGAGADVGALVAELAARAPVVVVLDHYENFRLMDTWLRRTLVPSLPNGAALLLGCRERPVASWLGVPGFRALPIGPLAEADAFALLEERGVRAAEAARLNRIARGHPLALVLASAGAAEHPRLALEDAAMTRVVEELTRLYFEDVEDPLTRRALEAASVVRRATESLFDAMLDGDGALALHRLLQLPFVVPARDGTLVHDAVRDAVAGHLRSTNPVRYREYRRAAWQRLRTEMRMAAPAELWSYTADTLFLLDNPVVREAFFPSDAQSLVVEPATALDAGDIEQITRRQDGPGSARLLAQWWIARPEAFSVCRDRDGRTAGFFLLLEGDSLRRPHVGADPVVGGWARHLQSHPLRRGESALGLRRWLDRDRGEAPGPTQAACWLDVKRTYMALRPGLRRMYVAVNDAPSYWPVVRELGFRPLSSGAVGVDGMPFSTVVLDFGEHSVDGWLVDLLARELGVADEPAVDAEAGSLTVGGVRVALTPLEFGLFEHLRQREGRTVTRTELLRDVWESPCAVGSNVVDAVVHTLRGKLGPAAAAVESVRGRGYRLREDWRVRL